MKTVYVIPSGYQDSVQYIYGWLRTYGCTPKIGDNYKRSDGRLCSTIEVPDEEFEQVCLLAKTYPARFGNESEIRRVASGDKDLKPVQP